MSEVLHYFKNNRGGLTAAALPFGLETLISEWSALVPHMARNRHEAFSRAEWAYLITFLEESFLRQTVEGALGEPAQSSAGAVTRLLRPRGQVAVWLPNNVSLLGPLSLILISLTGNPAVIRGGSRSENLTRYFIEFALAFLPAGVLRHYLEGRVKVVDFPRDDPRHREMAEESRVRVVFGSDASARAIDSLPHPADSIGFSFIDRQSEAWIEAGAATDSTLEVLIRVLAVYGRAGCTSPQKVVVPGGSREDAVELCERLAALWPLAVRGDVERHVASENVKCSQWASALGWEPVMAARNGAVFAAGDFGLPPFTGAMALPVVHGSAEEAVLHLPPNIQTVGYALLAPADEIWLALLSRTRIKRFVPVSRMHHFGPVWDGFSFWRSMFEEVEILR